MSSYSQPAKRRNNFFSASHQTEIVKPKEFVEQFAVLDDRARHFESEFQLARQSNLTMR
jgi:hypothetical protein